MHLKKPAKTQFNLLYIYELIFSLHLSHAYVMHILVQNGHPTIGNGNIHIVSTRLTNLK